MKLLFKNNSMGTSNYTTFISIVLGIILIMSYLFLSLRRQNFKPSLADALTVFLSAVMIVQGVYICYVGFNSHLSNCIAIEPPFLVMTGIAIIWLSVERILKLFRSEDNSTDSTKSIPNPNPTNKINNL